MAADPVDLGPSRRQPGAQLGRRCLDRSSRAAGRPEAGWPRSPSRVADTALSQKRLARTRTRSQSTTHPKGPTTRLTAPAYWKFESISLQRGVCKPSVPQIVGWGVLENLLAGP